MQYDKEFNTNKDTWNQKVVVHSQSRFYNLEGFKAGDSSLNSFELEALGDVNGKSLLHLQCHFGQDTLSWSRLGANCTGVDISDKGIDLARDLARELNLDATFVCCNVLDTSKHVSDTFDIVFTSYGVIGWLPDLKPWGQMIAERLKPGGVFYIAEFHPIVWMFDYLQQPAVMRYGYQQKEAIYEEYEGSYTKDSQQQMISKEYGWNHGLGQVVNALTAAGLKVEYLKEHESSPYDVFPGLKKGEDGLYRQENGLFPLMFELKATK